MDLTQLNYFRTAARTGNLSKAAQELFVTQPNLSRSISRLEEELGVPLFDHRKGKVALNEYGRVFLSSVELAFDQLNTGAQTIRRLYEADQNILSLASTIDDFLPDVLKDFSREHPEIGIRQFNCSQEQIVQRLLDRTLTMAVTSRPIKEDAVTFELLGEMPYALLVRQDHPLAGREGVHLAELAGEAFICDTSRMGLSTLRTICAMGGFRPKVAYEAESSELIYQLLEGGAGVSFLPMSQYVKLEGAHADNPVRLLPVLDDIPNAVIGVAYHKNLTFSAAARTFAAFVRAWLADERNLLGTLGWMPAV